jgi:hypothetical protein
LFQFKKKRYRIATLRILFNVYRHTRKTSIGSLVSQTDEYNHVRRYQNSSLPTTEYKEDVYSNAWITRQTDCIISLIVGI